MDPCAADRPGSRARDGRRPQTETYCYLSDLRAGPLTGKASPGEIRTSPVRLSHSPPNFGKGFRLGGAPPRKKKRVSLSWGAPGERGGGPPPPPRERGGPAPLPFVFGGDFLARKSICRSEAAKSLPFRGTAIPMSSTRARIGIGHVAAPSRAGLRYRRRGLHTPLRTRRTRRSHRTFQPRRPRPAANLGPSRMSTARGAVLAVTRAARRFRRRSKPPDRALCAAPVGPHPLPGARARRAAGSRADRPDQWIAVPWQPSGAPNHPRKT